MIVSIEDLRVDLVLGCHRLECFVTSWGCNECSTLWPVVRFDAWMDLWGRKSNLVMLSCLFVWKTLMFYHRLIVLKGI